MRKVKLLYFSPTDTTKKVVSAIGSAIGEVHSDYSITLPSERTGYLKFEPDDIVIIGAPVYAGRVPPIAMDYFDKVEGNNTYAVFVVLYGNRDFDDALLEMKDRFENRGFIGIAGGAFIGEHSLTANVATDRPDPRDIEKAREFGSSISELLRSESTADAKLFVKGNYPYRKGMTSAQVGPKTEDSCIQCGVCAEFCPTGAISFQDYSNIDKSKCIMCCSCVKRCPVDAKFFNDDHVLKMAKKLETNFSQLRKEPEIFMTTPLGKNL